MKCLDDTLEEIWGALKFLHLAYMIIVICFSLFLSYAFD